MESSPRMTLPTALILGAIASGARYGFDIMDATGLPSGTVYPALRRLEGAGLLVARWEAAREAEAAGRPRRRLYELTGAGVERLPAARVKLDSLPRLVGGRIPRPADG